MADYIDKYKIKDEGLRLEKEEPEKAIDYYNGLLNHEYFVNDFWPYRRLVLMYKKTREFDKKTDIIKTFFKSGIYCNNHQFLWFRNKLKALSEKHYITPDEIDSLTDYFKTHSLVNKEKANIPLPIADRIRKQEGEIIVVSEEEYEKKQKQYEYDARCTELNRQKRYGEYIELLNHMIDDLGYSRYDYFKKLCVAYRRFNDYDNELRIINKYMNGESTRTKVSDEWFEKRLKDVESIKGSKSRTKELEDEIKTLKKEKEELLKRIAELENKKPKKEKPKKKNYPNISDFENKYVYEIPFNLDDLNLDKPPIYEYNPTLNELENLKRKNILIQYGKLLTRNKQTNDAIRYYKYLCNNTYFANDWYPYRQLTILYNKTKDDNANLINIKKLFHSNTYLNRYQFVWFTEKIRRILEKSDVNEDELKEWLEYYETHGALNESKSNKFLADKFIKLNDNTIIVITDEYFDYRQERYALEETGRVYERVGNYELAITHYKKIIDEREFNFYRFYQRLCYCFEKLEDYSSELEAINLYYNNPPIDTTEYSDEWFAKRLKKVNKELDTNSEDIDKCPKCGASLIKKNGKFGEFLGCSNYPDCNFTKDIRSKNKVKKTKIEDNSSSFQDDKYKSKVKLAKEFVISNLNITVKDLLILKQWDEEVELCMNILDDSVTPEDKEYIESVLGYAHHRRDKRSSLEYACDLIVGWVIEDCTVEILNKLGYTTSLNSADKHRKILLSPTADSDLKVYINGKDVLIEQVNDFTGYWKKTLHVPLRDNKYINLKNENSLLFGIDYVNELFFILNVPETEANYIPYHRPFSKPAYAILITDDDFYNLDKLEFVLSKILLEY